MKKVLPIGVDNFEKLVLGGYCYVDKTMLVKDLLDLKCEVNLFTRPRRFGKTLNLSMLHWRPGEKRAEQDAFSGA